MPSSEPSSETTAATEDSGSRVLLYWLPLGAGGAARVVRISGRLFEAVAARRARREPCALYHSALEVLRDGERFTIEMAPVWQSRAPHRGVVVEGAVGSPLLGRSRLFRYEVRRWRDGVVPDLADAVGSPLTLSVDLDHARAVLELVPAFPSATWGRDEQDAGEMWNSNSLTAWLLSRSGHGLDGVRPPSGGRAPGWTAGLVVAGRARDPAVTAPPRAGASAPRERPGGGPPGGRQRR